MSALERRYSLEQPTDDPMLPLAALDDLDSDDDAPHDDANIADVDEEEVSEDDSDSDDARTATTIDDGLTTSAASSPVTPPQPKRNTLSQLSAFAESPAPPPQSPTRRHGDVDACVSAATLPTMTTRSWQARR